MYFKLVIKSLIYLFKIIAGPLIGLLSILLFPLDADDMQLNYMLGIIIWMASWWIFQTVPLGITALMPVFLFPMTGIMSTDDVAGQYLNQVIFLFIGGCLVAFTIERWGLHQRMALVLINNIGYSKKKILAGFMLSSFILSMWISNSATAIMLLAPALALISQMDGMLDIKKANIFASGLLLAIAYSASIGGASTLVGTPPNLIFAALYAENFPELKSIGFADWFILVFPVSLLFLIIMFFYFNKVININLDIDGNIFKKQLKSLGKTSFEEKIILLLFFILVILWFSRAGLNLGSIEIPGWSEFLPFGDLILDSTVAVFIAALLFLIPSKNKKGEKLATKEELKKLPIDVIFLFGGGFALAKGFQESGLANYLAEQFIFLEYLPIILIVLVICIFMVIITEFSSNTASTQLILPVLIVLSANMNIPPHLLMLPATIAASFAFMLPVATPPNTIIFGSERVTVSAMLKKGFWMNITGVCLIVIANYTIWKWLI
ncbi:MAG: SLC13/DASS family transporter [Chitinophagaceae bacterium]|nr:MAG: SLC13/DASS family transporter [Chitinophagaceae bacterium]